MSRRTIEQTIGQVIAEGVYSGGLYVYEKNTAGKITRCSGNTIPVNATTGFAVGCEFRKDNAALGQCVRWINVGTATSCLFRPHGAVIGYGIAYAGGPIDCVNGAAAIVVSTAIAKEADLVFAGHYESDDNDQVQAVATAAKNFATITNSADPLTAHDYVWVGLRTGCIPGWDIVAAGKYTTVGGNAAEAITVADALAGDIALVAYGGTDDTDVIRQAVVTAATLTVTMSANPSTAHILYYVVLRPRGAFKPSHYIAYAGTKTCDTGSATQTLAVSGVLATDVVISTWHTSDDADSILKVVPSADLLTWTLSADPLTAHKLNYMVLRAY